MSRGRFITVEGGEGAGKSTQARLLCAGLRNRGVDVVATREPGGAPGAEEIRTLLTRGSVARWQAMSEALLHFAARVEHMTETIVPALDAGRWVVSDRFTDSTIAYQGYGHGLGRDAMTRLRDIVIGDFVPDLTLILDLPADVGLERTRNRPSGEDRYERMKLAFHERLRGGFLEIAAGEPQRCAVVDATADIEAVHATIEEIVGTRLPL